MLVIRNDVQTQKGISLIEVLVTIVIIAFGLLGLAGFLIQVQASEWEAYQRAQALNLVNEMAERINVNKDIAATYPTAVTYPVGTGFTDTTCGSLAVGTAQRDICEWSVRLKGAAEVSSSSTNIGAMEGARGCISVIQPPNSTAGICLPGIYQVSVAWQGRNKVTPIPDKPTCGEGLYGDDAYRRVLTQTVSVALLTCN
jgi:type IV pilus assembly protein PilV